VENRLAVMRPYSLTYLAFFAALAAVTGARAQTADPLRPADLLDPATEDVLAPEETAEQVPAKVQPKAIVEEPPPPIRRKRKPELDPYAPQGIAAGGLRLFPTLEVDGVVSSNPEQKNSGGKAALGWRLAPSLRLESDWVRHSFTLNARGSFIDFAGSGISPDSTGNVRAAARVDVLRTTTVDFDANYDVEETSAADSEVPDTAKGPRFEHEIGGFTALTHQYGRLGLRARTGARARLFEDVDLVGGGKEDNSDRNYVEPELSLRATYETSPALKPFAEIAYRPRYHFETPDRSGLDRDSQGLQLRAGLAFDRSPIWTGEIGLAYVVRDYQDSSLDTINAVGVIGNVVWKPTELTTLTLTANTSIDETIAANAGGTRVYEARIDAEHLLRENIVLRAGSRVEFDSRKGPNDVTYDGNLGVIYRFNPWLAWTAGYDFTYFDSGFPKSDYVEHRVLTGIEIRR
jgi:hypothetical protein